MEEESKLFCSLQYCAVVLVECLLKHGHVSLSGYFNGELIPANQPKLLTGGVMRSYQLDGMEWIKVSHHSYIIRQSHTHM